LERGGSAVMSVAIPSPLERVKERTQEPDMKISGLGIKKGVTKNK